VYPTRLSLGVPGRVARLPKLLLDQTLFIALPPEAGVPVLPAGRFSGPQMDDLLSLLEVAYCPVRDALLMQLSGHPVEPTHVSDLAGRTAIDQNTVSHHLAVLRRGGFVRSRRQGKHTYYTPVPGRVRVDRQPSSLSLTLRLPSGAWLTLGVPVDAPPPSADTAAENAIRRRAAEAAEEDRE
jgi:DNA-binding transcriptional ArsR family regulator